MLNKKLNLRIRGKEILTLFSRAKTGLLRFLRKRDRKLYSGIKRKVHSDKCFKLNYMIPANSMKDPVEFLRMQKRKNTERI